MKDQISSAISKRANEAREILVEMLKFESTPGNEAGVIDFCNDKFKAIGLDSKLVPITNDIKNDPEYSHPETPLDYTGRANMVAFKHGKGGGRSALLQSHVDVVPAGEWDEAFDPKVEGDYIIGRGSCDAKGQVASIWLAMAALQDLGVELNGEVQAQVVIEEELGGNGALDLIRKGYLADVAFVMEGSELDIHPANRGAIWFKIEIEGLPCHMGRKHDGISAIDLSYKVIQALYEYEKNIIADSANYPGFEKYKNPVQVNVGLLHSGTWPAMVAANAVIEGGVGFLPNRSMDQVKQEVKEVIESIDDPWLQEHYKLSFPKLHNDSYEMDYSHPAIDAMKKACADSGNDSEVFGWNVSCDARLYAKVGKIPTFVFGPGKITEAHAKGEKIDFNELVKSAEIAARFIIDWCK